MTLLYSLTLFLSACLVFVIQPMVGKMLLPSLGGAYSVWNTCMVFFQALLLGGYIYSHLSTKYLGAKRQSILHIGVLLLPLLTLPIVISSDLMQTVPSESDPTLWLLGVLLITAGLPFFVVSSSAPIFQKWFSETSHRHAADPYFLYAASNAGSVAGLLIYPLVLERMASVSLQARLWQFGYIGLVLLAAGCALLMWLNQRSTPVTSTEKPAAPPLTMTRRLWWILLAFIPSSLMLGVTTYITTDIASAPLLWIIPLALYLVSFILVFARRPVYAPWWLGRGMCLLAVSLIVAFLVEVTHPPALLLTLHILLFFVAAIVVHGRLAKDRPSTSHLTEYFLWISVGGVLGGVFNALIAPLLFTHIFEYILVIALACAVRETKANEGEHRTWKKAAFYYVMIALSVVLIISVTERFELGVDPSLAIVAFGLPAIFACTQIESPRHFAVGLVILTVAGSFFTGYHQRPILFERNFYGSLRVADNYDGTLRQLIDGNTIHGRQRLDEPDRCIPLSYYYAPTSPPAYAFGAYNHRDILAQDTSNIAIIGMGIGSLACYGTPDQHWDLYELNPLVIEVATDPKYFSILDQANLGSREIIAGDGRLRIQNQPDDHYDIIVVDAFSSGSIPVHLLTREAIELYLDKLTEDGVMLFNVSNRVLNLPPILADIAGDLDIPAVVMTDDYVTQQEEDYGKDPSVWVFLAHHQEPLEFLRHHSRAQSLKADPYRKVWTDSYSDIISPLFSSPD